MSALKSMLAASVAASVLIASQASAQDGEAAPITVIHAGTLLAAPGEEPASTERSIVIQNGVITGVETGYIEPVGAEIVDLSDMYVLPGLIDSHVHISGELSATSRLDRMTLDDADAALDGARNARTTLRAGFTTVRDCGGPMSIFALRDAIRDGDVPGPRILASGPAITPTGGHGDINGYRHEIIDLFSGGNACNGADDCRRAVREAVRAGADFIKITATGGVLSNTNAGVGQQFFDDELEAIVETARMLGREVTAHAHGREGVEAALRAGVASIEHGTYLNEMTVDLFNEHEAYLVPTVLAGVTVAEMAEAGMLPPAVRDKALEVGPQMIDMLGIARRGGVRIAFGTDSGVSRHGQNARELELMLESGFSAEEAIAAATIVAAEHINLEEEIGRIAPGFSADIIAVSGDPYANISEMRDVDFVMARGEVALDPQRD